MTTYEAIHKHAVSTLLLLLLILLVHYTSCSNVRILPVKPVTVYSTKSQLCLKPPEIRDRLNKVLFVVDKSGSNVDQEDDFGNVTLGNDPEDKRRADNIQSFLDKHRTEPFYRWGYIAFGVERHKAHAYVNDGSVSNPIFSDANAMQAAINTHRAVDNDGCTPYLAGLSLARLAIEKDLQDHPDEDSVYNVFFMSDGKPNDTLPASGNSNCGDISTIQDVPTDPYISAVKNLVRTAPDRIFFSTAYYTLPANDPGRVSAKGLEYMAKAGGGKFVDLENNDTLDFDELLLGPRPESWIMKRMVIYNFNGANCNDGSRGSDSDADGICDRDEIYYNELFAKNLPDGKKFDPVNRNSIDSNYSDLFSLKFKVMPTAEGLRNCTDLEADKDFDLLNSCEERMLSDSQANGPTNEWSEALRTLGGGTADARNPDSDGDGFLDSIEFFTFGIKSAAVNYTNIFNRYDGGITGETILAEQRHPRSPESFGPENTNLKVTYSGFNAEGENCYNIDLKSIAVFDTKAVPLEQASNLGKLAHEKSENVILMYYIMTQERNPNGKGYLFYKYQTVTHPQGFSHSLSFENFIDYKIPERY